MLSLRDVVQATDGDLSGAAGGLEVPLTRVVVDSRQVQAGALFVALRGQKHDGHAFVAQALADGAAGALVERIPPECAAGPPLVVVPSTQKGLEAMARWAFDHHPGLDVVGITGSVGKTTTKEVVAGVLAQTRSVLKSEGNLNSEIGLPLTVLNGLRPEHEVAVLEMGMYQPGDIRLLARLARPRIGVVTTVQPVHLERLGTIERIAGTKRELVEELPADGGVAVLNRDDARVAAMAAASLARVVHYGLADDADVRADQIESHGLKGVEFDLVVRGSRGRHVRLPLLGAQSVHAALAAAAVGIEEGMTLDDIAEALHQLTPTLRLLVVDGINGSRIVDDSYNASPESVMAALALLRELPGQRKVAVLGDMLELGSEEEPGHRRVGTRAAHVVQLLIAYGRRSRTTAEAARRAGLGADQVVQAEDLGEIAELLRRRLRPGDDVLVKGSLGMGMATLVRALRAEAEGAEG